VYGYVELVGNRERGEGELIDGPRDRESREDAQKMFAQHERMMKPAKPAQRTKPD
jgi:hypothetical protein